MGLVCGTRLSKHYGLPIIGSRSTASRGATRQAPTFQPLLDADHPLLSLITNAPLIGVLCQLGPLDLPLGGVFQQSCAERLRPTCCVGHPIADRIASPPNLIGNVGQFVGPFLLAVVPVSPPKRLSIVASSPHRAPARNPGMRLVAQCTDNGGIAELRIG